MNFVQTEFLWFFALVFAGYWGLRERRRQNLFLLAASAVFYGWVHPFWLVLLYVAALTDFFAALAMERWPTHRRLALTLSVALNLGLLGYYKYVDFFIANAAFTLDRLGIDHHLVPLGVLLPAGISFYTFQSMAYSFDVYRRELKASRNVLDYLLAVSLFPHLVAGPVQRASNLLEQTGRPRSLSLAALQSGVGLTLGGVFKKVVIADQVAPYVDKTFSVPTPSTILVAAGSFGFAVQILADFSGYTDIARGIARMLGFELMENFRNPYLAANPSEFWRRWHISFSSWIRDYVYIPLGGSKGGFVATTLATFGALCLSGLWHGASWNFVLWGAYHATILTGYRLLTPQIPARVRSSWPGHVAAVALMFAFTLFGWYLFRETSLVRILAVLSQDPMVAPEAEQVAAAVMFGVALVLAAPLVGWLEFERLVWPRLSASPWRLLVQTTSWAVAGLSAYTFVRMSAADFIYFQF